MSAAARVVASTASPTPAVFTKRPPVEQPSPESGHVRVGRECERECCGPVAGDLERAGNVIGRAGGHHAEHGAASVCGSEGTSDGAIAARNHDAAHLLIGECISSLNSMTASEGTSVRACSTSVAVSVEPPHRG